MATGLADFFTSTGEPARPAASDAVPPPARQSSTAWLSIDRMEGIVAPSEAAAGIEGRLFPPGGEWSATLRGTCHAVPAQSTFGS